MRIRYRRSPHILVNRYDVLNLTLARFPGAGASNGRKIFCNQMYITNEQLGEDPKIPKESCFLLWFDQDLVFKGMANPSAHPSIHPTIHSLIHRIINSILRGKHVACARNEQSKTKTVSSLEKSRGELGRISLRRKDALGPTGMHRGFWREWLYAIWYYNGGYICPDPQDTQHGTRSEPSCPLRTPGDDDASRQDHQGSKCTLWCGLCIKMGGLCMWGRRARQAHMGDLCIILQFCCEH